MKPYAEVSLHEVSGRPEGLALLTERESMNHEPRALLKVTLSHIKWEGNDTMKLVITPSYAVNSPYWQYEKFKEYPSVWSYGAPTKDLRLEKIEHNVRRAWQAHGDYATEEEIVALMSIMPDLLAAIDRGETDWRSGEIPATLSAWKKAVAVSLTRTFL